MEIGLKKACMTRRCGSGIANFINNQPSWFKKLFPYVESRDSCNPNMATEPSFENGDGAALEDESSLNYSPPAGPLPC